MMEPVLVRINRRRCVLIGLAQAAMALFVLLLVALPLSIGLFDWLIAAGLLVAAFFGWFAIYFFGLARKNPVALRLDEQGISGFYTEPATWNEIQSAFAFKNSKGHSFLGFVLADPVGFRDRQSAWRRFRVWSNWHGNGAHIFLPQSVMAETTAETLAETARRFLAQRHDPPAA